MQNLHQTVEKRMYLNSTQNHNDLLEKPYHYYYEHTPRFTSKDTFHSLFQNMGKPLSATDEKDALQIFRSLRFYSDLERVKRYEISNAYAYEAALRTTAVKEMLVKALNHPLRNIDEILFHDQYWLDVYQVLKFESARYLDTGRIKIKKKFQGTREEELSPKKTLPVLHVPSDMTEYVPVQLNMFLPEKELIGLLEGYIEKLKEKRSQMPHLKNTGMLTSQYVSNVKLMRNKNNIVKDFQNIRDKVEKPDSISLKLSEMYFAYDMVELGFDRISIAESIQSHRISLLYRLNKDYEKKYHEDIQGVIEEIVGKVDPNKTIDKWHTEIKKIIVGQRYKKFLAPETLDLCMDGYYTEE